MSKIKMKKILKKIETVFFELILMFKNGSFSFYLVFFGFLADFASGYAYSVMNDTELHELACKTDHPSSIYEILS